MTAKVCPRGTKRIGKRCVPQNYRSVQAQRMKMGETRYCEHCYWGVRKTKRGFAVYDSDKKFHHFVKTGSTDENFFKKGLCPIHGTKLK